jgi:ligand-binding SRPBCC domain-containing protein
MPTFERETIIHASLQAVWDWHMNVREAFMRLAPPEDQIELEHLDEPMRDGARLVFRARGPLGKWIRWEAVHEDVRPPHAVAFGMEARFTDVQARGPFAHWRHTHTFEFVDERTTRLVDFITYRPPLWPLSWPAEALFIRGKITRMFDHRARVLAAVFPEQSEPQMNTAKHR